MALDTLFLPLLAPPPAPVQGDTGTGGSGSNGSGSGDGGSGSGGSGSGDTGGTDDTGGTTETTDTSTTTPQTGTRYEGDEYAYEAAGGDDGSLVVTAVRAAELPATITVVAPLKGKLTFLSASTSPMPKLPDGTDIAADTILFTVEPTQLGPYQVELPGRPVPASWAFTGIDTTSFDTHLEEWKAAATQQEVATAWPDPTTPPADDKTSRDNWKARVLAGTFDVQLEAGAAIGDLAATAYQLTIRTYQPRPKTATTSDLVHPALVLPSFDDANPALVGHPLIDAVADIDIDVQIFLKFQYLKVDNSTKSPKAVLAPLADTLVEAINLGPGTAIDSARTAADGRVTFFASNWDWWGLGGTADIYFGVTVEEKDAIVRQWGRKGTWHGTWSTLSVPLEPAMVTSDFKTIDGQAGYYPDYAKWTLGTESSPLVFNLGTPLVLRAKYQAQRYPATINANRPLARGTEIQLCSTMPDLGQKIVETFYADEDGEVWATCFDVEPGNDLELVLPLAIAENEDAGFVDSIELPRVVTVENPLPWSGQKRSPTTCYWAAFGAPSIGSTSPPLDVVVASTPTDDDIAAFLYFLRCVRETHLWWRTITGEEWKGIEGAWINLNDNVVTSIIDYAASLLGTGTLTSMNPPNAGVLLRGKNKWDRSTMIHETSHGVMWAITGNTVDFLCAIVKLQYGQHYTMTELSGFAALVEGWADLAANALGGLDETGGPGVAHVPATPPTQVQDSSFHMVNLAAPIGLAVEGCFAGAYWEWMRTSLKIEPCVDSDEKDLQLKGTSGPGPNTTIAPASADFKRGLWDPVKGLSGSITPTTSDLLALAEPSLGINKWANLNHYLSNWGLT